VNQFTSIENARVKIEAWRIDYNAHWPHSSLGHRAPAEIVRPQHTAGTIEKAGCPGGELSAIGSNVIRPGRPDSACLLDGKAHLRKPPLSLPKRRDRAKISPSR